MSRLPSIPADMTAAAGNLDRPDRGNRSVPASTDIAGDGDLTAATEHP
jgi:hypothetical protein